MPSAPRSTGAIRTSPTSGTTSATTTPPSASERPGVSESPRRVLIIGNLDNRRVTGFCAALARGGVGMTTVAYCAVAESGRTFSDQLVMRAETVAPLRVLTDAVHEAGGAAAIQLAHCGGFSKDLANARRVPKGPLGPSLGLNLYGLLRGLIWTRPMSEADIEAVIDQFAVAAERAVAAGFDAVELHLGHGYLLSQFLSPAINRRRDRWGGSLENRLRFTWRVLDAIRAAVGPDFIVGLRMVADEDWERGLSRAEGVEIARRLAASGQVDFLNLIRGHIETDAALADVIPIQGMRSAPHLDFAGEVRAETGFPVL
ncbi:MAG: hypothetical protein KC457_25865, partial [Myxococcales bacterium]|nr:hypothetical protein [Myxococcales bacterium]